MSGRDALLRGVLYHLQASNVTLSELIKFVIVQNRSNNPGDTFFQDIMTNVQIILSALHLHPATKASAAAWARNLTLTEYSDDVRELTDTSHGWHFGAQQADPVQVRDFRLDDMAGNFEHLAPNLWSLVIALLGGWAEAKKGDSGADGDADSDQYWEEDIDEEEPNEHPAMASHRSRAMTANSGAENRRRNRRNLLTRIKSVVIISILMHNQDQQCNALQSLTGIFLHSCGAPEKLVKVLSRMGLSIAPTSIQRAIKSMSEHSADDVEDLARTLLASYAFDNLDTKVPSGIPSVDKPQDGLIHITTGTLLRLEHGVTTEDLRCARLLWSRSENNPSPDADPRPFDARATMRRLLTLHREPDLSNGSLTRRGRFRKWCFMRTVLKFGPPAFSRFLAQLADPEVVEAIPVKKLHQVPLRAMDISLSTVSGNIKAVDAMYVQGGVGDPHQNSPTGDTSISDLSEYVTLVHGDLGTYEHILAAIRRRKQERTPHNRLQPVAFVLGLFHLKMAAADAVWRMLVLPDGIRGDYTSFIKLVGKLRPNESSRLVSGAKFRERHDLINHVGVLLQLDAWRVEVKKRWGFATLEEWAASNPKLSDIEEVAEQLALEYAEGDGQDISQWASEGPGNVTGNSSQRRDQVWENTMRTLNYLFLYEELSYAMNAGDIGRVETVFPVWIQLFRAVGKHKYANLMLRFMHVLYFIYPEGLQCVVRLPIYCP
ncbi:hypothetical protein C8Q78DRAFT_1083139 [Trametes maxima]|nr:hypothetical protein C8Q78DRAFT_1083139 [Trametes maxima]